MFAIELKFENLEKIKLSSDLTKEEVSYLTALFCNEKYVFISGYYDRKNRLVDWGILPMSELKHSFEYDPDKIKTEWDIVVRKPAA